MKVTEGTISAIGKIVTGDEQLSPYRSGPQLVRLFNDYGANDVYGQGFPSRWHYAEEKIRSLNGTAALGSLLCQVLDPREFMDTKFKVEEAVQYINARLKYDGYEVVIDNGYAKIRDLTGVSVACEHPFQGSEKEGHLFIDEQIQKSEIKIKEGDYDGAITNARSLLEAVLTELEKTIDENAPQYDGDLLKLYKRVQKLLNLEPGRPDIEGPLKQVLSGLVSIVGGMAGLSNRMGDRHVRTYKPEKHHAVLVVNAAKTIVNFLFETYEYQKKRKSINKAAQSDNVKY
ncbi:abortive infection family protein [Nitrosophilus alvini]|uniref:abortive infection family protein n=1 Tax=Nitrosophilus alvini TaxID=2714855 RepID=UPI00190A2C03|nr:abortive infection family protein [Nitrosophilus alvini]